MFSFKAHFFCLVCNDIQIWRFVIINLKLFVGEADDGEELAAMITNENETENEAGESQADADDSHSKLNSDNSHGKEFSTNFNSY